MSLNMISLCLLHKFFTYFIVKWHQPCEVPCDLLDLRSLIQKFYLLLLRRPFIFINIFFLFISCNVLRVRLIHKM